MTIEQIDKWITIIALIIGLGGCFFCLCHHLFIKPRQDERQKQLNLKYETEVQKIFNKFRNDNIKGG